MYKSKKRAFTLTELLVVVIVLGTLAAVAVPKFSRVLETRRTGEAEEMLSAVRTEQEKRCTLGQNYTGDFSKMSTVAYAKSAGSQGQTSNYTYTLTSTGVEAVRSGKDYVLKIPSYKTGEICCEGSGCDALNKSYPSCATLSLPAADECAAEDVVVEEDPCDTNPNSCSCTTYAAAHRCECDADYASANACECNPSTETCCGEEEEWNAETGSCEATDECEDSYGVPVQTSKSTDTCDGDVSNKYTCDGSFQGTCVDVYTLKLTIGSFSRDMQDPFLNFVDGLLAANTGQCAGKIYCGQQGTRACCCSSGYYCDMSTAVGGVGCGTCVKGSGPATGDFEKVCLDGQTWNAQLQACVVSIDTDIPVFKTCQSGYHWDEAAGKCVKDEEEIEIIEKNPLRFQRTVTCCGNGQGSTEQTCAQNPNQEKCCADNEKWDGNSCVASERCEPPADGPSGGEMECPNGYSGSITLTWNYETCQWDTVNNCVCAPAENESATQICPTDQYYEGEMTRTWNSQTCQWSDWDYSACKPKVSCCRLVQRRAEFKWNSGSIYNSYCNNYSTETTSSKITYYGNTAMNKWYEASSSKNTCPTKAQAGVILSGSKKGWSCYRNPSWLGTTNGCVSPQATANVWTCEDIPWSVGTAKKCSPDEITSL